jgi:dihydrodipicolinate synthase/N-acetylneuraminate lyase/quercetin dioxygenase-like cupin family protein
MRAAARRRPRGHALAVSISDNALATTRRLSEVAGEVAADVLMLSPPNYFANDLQMLVEYVGAVGEFASADICLYDNPVASHTLLSVADIKQLADAVPRLTHIKVTDTAIEKVAALRLATDLVICAGDDAVLWNQLARGVDAAMVALPMIAPEIAAALWRAYERGAMDEAFDAYARAAPFLHSSLGASDYVGVIKAVLEHRGIIGSAEVRLPLVALPERRRAEVIAALRSLAEAPAAPVWNGDSTLPYTTVDAAALSAAPGPHPAASPYDKGVGAALGLRAFGAYQVELPPGAETVRHDHRDDGAEDMYAVLRGSGVVVVDGEEVAVHPGRFIAVAPESRRSVRAGSEGLVFIAVCAPLAGD